MSITAYTGLPGHGKTYGIIEHVIVPACKNFRTVYTNIPINKDVFLDRFGIAPIHFKIDDIISNPDWFSNIFESGSIFVIDEAWRLWPAGTSSNKLDVRHKEFFAEHRHLVSDTGFSTEIVICTQDLSQIAMFVRSLVETTFRVTKLSKIGTPKFYRVDVYSGSVTGSSPPISKREREIGGKFNKDIYQLYVSHTKSQHGAGNEKRTDGRFNVLKGSGFKMILVSFFVLGFFVWYGSGSLFSFGRSQEVVDPVLNVPLNVDNPTLNPKRREQSIFDLADHFYIVYNLGRYPDFSYLVRFDFDGTYADLNAIDLQVLGYTIQSINQCLLKIISSSSSFFVACKSPDDDQSGLVESLASVNPLP